jgi:hypothetical protein
MVPVVVPLTITEAPTAGSPVDASFTVPVISLVWDMAANEEIIKAAITVIIRLSLSIFIDRRVYSTCNPNSGSDTFEGQRARARNSLANIGIQIIKTNIIAEKFG